MKYLKDKNSRRRGVAIELAIMLLLVMAAVSTIITTTTMIQINKQKESFNEVDDLLGEIEKIEYDQIGKAFEKEISNLTFSLDKAPEEYDCNLIKQGLENRLNEQFSYYLNSRDLLIEVGLTKVETAKDPINSTSTGSQEKVETVTDTVDPSGIATRIIISTEMTDGITKKVTTTKRRQSNDTTTNPEDIIENGEKVGSKTTEINTQVWNVTIETYTEYDTTTIFPYDVTYTFTLSLYKKIGNDVEGNALKGDLLLEVMFEKNGLYSITTTSKIKKTIIETQVETEITTNVTKNYTDEGRVDETEPTIKESQFTERIIDDENSDTVVTTTYSYSIEKENSKKISWIYK